MKLTFIEPNGTTHQREGVAGQSVMELAVGSSVPGILGDCGGSCACATCHVHVDPAWLGKLPAAADFETDMLEIVDDRDETSRLGCQIRLTDELDGLVVRLSASLL